MNLTGKHVLVRCTNAGVHTGELVSLDGQQVELKSARRVWYWKGAFTLSELSQTGPSQSGSRIAIAVPYILLLDAIEIIPTTEAAQAAIEACHE